LPQFRGVQPPVYHKFPVFSVIDEHDNVKPKFAQCSSCGVVHKVTEIGRSEIVIGNDSTMLVLTKFDIASQLPPALAQILENALVPIAVWEECKYVLDTRAWGTAIVLSTTHVAEKVIIKRLTLKSKNLFSIDSEIYESDRNNKA